MPEEIRIAGLQTGIYDDTQRIIFLQNMGYVYSTQLELKEYFVNQGIVQRLLLDGQTIHMAKAVNPNSIYNAGGIVDSSDNSLITINNPMYNPLFRAKMDRIRFGDMTPEAADFYNSFMRQKQQEAMQNQMMWRTPPPQPNAGVWQNQMNPGGFDATMTPGAYHMPNLPGMNYQM
jgi:hypothetical protein